MLRSIGKQSGESVESVRKKVGYGGKELQKWKVLSLEWKSEGVMDDESGEAEFERLVQGWQREAGSWFQRRGEAYWKELSVTNMCIDDQRWRASAAGRLNCDEVMQIWRLGGCENFVGERSLYSMRSVNFSQYIQRQSVHPSASIQSNHPTYATTVTLLNALLFITNKVIFNTCVHTVEWNILVTEQQISETICTSHQHMARTRHDCKSIYTLLLSQSLPVRPVKTVA